jgi:trans-2,3-dihydro-3-hydroxyanthranilate isomerase
MATYRYRLVNVFTQDEAVLSGNPLCVVENGAALGTLTMQALARQFNLSETTFILPSSKASARVRIFTPSYELPFAGHPTLGTAHVCRALGLGADTVTLEMQAGVIPVSACGQRWTLRANAPTWREVDASREQLAAMLGLTAADLGERALWVNAGREQLVVPLVQEAAVRRVRPRAEALAELASVDGASMVYVFAPTDGAADKLLARFFFPQGQAVLEDPATGSAAANLGGWLLALDRPLPYRCQIAQGEYTQRPSTVHLEVDDERGIHVGGDVMELGRGALEL